MKLQQGISENNLKQKIGNTYEVLIENTSFDGKYYIGRSYMDVPDMDGVIFIENPNKETEKIGKFVKCQITDISEYDLIAKTM